jgi:drug/metabolite transporter (DMT)-like permease
MSGIPAALAAALLFGAATPLAKLLLGPFDPWMLAGVLYLGSGIGLAFVRFMRIERGARIGRHDIPWLVGAIAAGGLIAPVLLMWGLAHSQASAASLLLNGEGVFTALIAWFVFRENFDRRIALGMLLILLGAVVLSWPSDHRLEATLPSLAILAACWAWALDNNVTRKVALVDATTIAMLKGLAAGAVNLGLALAAGSSLPAAVPLASAAGLGFVSYGLSLVLFVSALRGLGTARTAAYFSTAPFAGAALSVFMFQEDLTWRLGAAAVLMGVGVWLHLTEHHVHTHSHETMDHEHEHEHDLHHQHAHAPPVAPGTQHSHWHRHEPAVHSHEHYPDSHHRHRHQAPSGRPATCVSQLVRAFPVCCWSESTGGVDVGCVSLSSCAPGLALTPLPICAAELLVPRCAVESPIRCCVGDLSVPSCAAELLLTSVED